MEQGLIRAKDSSKDSFLSLEDRKLYYVHNLKRTE